jgi:hypothetical protein
MQKTKRIFHSCSSRVLDRDGSGNKSPFSLSIGTEISSPSFEGPDSRTPVDLNVFNAIDLERKTQRLP